MILSRSCMTEALRVFSVVGLVPAVPSVAHHGGVVTNGTLVLANMQLHSRKLHGTLPEGQCAIRVNFGDRYATGRAGVHWITLRGGPAHPACASAISIRPPPACNHRMPTTAVANETWHRPLPCAWFVSDLDARRGLGAAATCSRAWCGT